MKQHAPSAERNKDEILEVLSRFLPAQGTVLEVASGSGQHAVHFAPAFAQVNWQPTDRDPKALASIAARVEEAALPNLLAPLALDLTWPAWPLERADAVVGINMLHISPWEACEGFLAGAARVLSPGAPLFYYGPLIRAGVPTAPGNLAFDRSLRERDPAWGVRELGAILAAASPHGFSLDELVEMPNNNCAWVLRRG